MYTSLVLSVMYKKEFLYNNIPHNDIEYLNKTVLANTFNRFFNQVAEELSGRLPHSRGVDHLDYVSRVVQS